MSSSGPPKPIFGIEIEIFVKVKRDVERDVQNYRSRGSPLPTHWQEWSFSLTNDQPTSTDTMNRQQRQRACVKLALTSLINDALGRNHGWKCVGDASLSEWKLKEAPESDLWCKFQSAPQENRKKRREKRREKKKKMEKMEKMEKTN